MSRISAALVLGVAVYATLSASARAADVVALRLPANLTVDPEGERRLISVTPDGTVAALASSADPTRPRSLAVRWDAGGTRTAFVPPPPQFPGGYTPPVIPSGVVAGRGLVYVTIDEPFSGAYMGVVKSVDRWTTGSRRHGELAGCAAGENHDETVAGADATGQVAATFERTGFGSHILLPEAYETAPYAFVIDVTGCHPRGRATILNVRDTWASGYRGYIEHRVAPSNYGEDGEDVVAVRWHAARLVELGEGVAYAVSSRGLAIGATALPGRPHGAAPQAVAWDVRGRRYLLDATAARSVAYDVADDGTIVGMLTARDGRHYAFRRTRGRLERLDDLPHPPGWRFESAYAIAADGTVIGVGTYRGFATVFRWRPV